LRISFGRSQFAEYTDGRSVVLDGGPIFAALRVTDSHSRWRPVLL